MRQHAYEAARRGVADNDTLILSQQAFEAFVAACEQPSEPNEALRTLILDENFVNLLRAEGLDSLPKYIAERVWPAGSAS